MEANLFYSKLQWQHCFTKSKIDNFYHNNPDLIKIDLNTLFSNQIHLPCMKLLEKEVMSWINLYQRP